MGLIRTAAVGAIGYALYKYATKDSASDSKVTPVRDAGPDNMKNRPKSWSKTDEALDETFPASDAVAVY